MFDYVDGAYLIKGLIGKRVREAVEIANYIRAASWVAIDTNRPWMLSYSTAYIEYPHVRAPGPYKRPRQSSSVSIAKSAWSREMVSGGLNRRELVPADSSKRPR